MKQVLIICNIMVDIVLIVTFNVDLVNKTESLVFHCDNLNIWVIMYVRCYLT